MKSGDGAKKDETRYTIRFNPADPRHQRAMAALDTAGRRKAALIADAICEYLARYSEDEAVAPKLYAKHTKQTIEFKPAYGMAHENENVGLIPVEEEIMSVAQTSESSVQALEPLSDRDNTDSMESTPINDDMRQAILGGLSMFNGQAEIN